MENAAGVTATAGAAGTGASASQTAGTTSEQDSST